MKFDIEFLRSLNEEYKNRPLQESSPIYTDEIQDEVATKRLAKINKLIDLNGKTILEIGCGHGHTSRALRDQYNAKVTAIDVIEHEAWKNLAENGGVDFRVVDLAKENPFQPKSFDLIMSHAVFEHIKHPFSVLKECVNLIKDDGLIYIKANQYRSALGSHLYRDIYFPYPHLLFPTYVLEEFVEKDVPPSSYSKYVFSNLIVNKLTYSHYKEYFRLLGLNVTYEKFQKRKLDLEFYERFEEVLGLYPKFDLELDFFEAILTKDLSPEKSYYLNFQKSAQETASLKKELNAATKKIAELEKERAGFRTKLKTVKKWPWSR